MTTGCLVTLAECDGGDVVDVLVEGERRRVVIAWRGRYDGAAVRAVLEDGREGEIEHLPGDTQVVGVVRRQPGRRAC